MPAAGRAGAGAGSGHCQQQALDRAQAKQKNARRRGGQATELTNKK